MPMATPDPGRNDPCPCGSGRKYKHCCLAASVEEDAARLRLRGAEGRLVPTLFERALEGWGKPFFMEAWEAFFLWKDVPEDVQGTPEFETLFLPWFVFTFVSDPAPRRRHTDTPARPIALHFLDTCPDEYSDLDRRFINAACASPFSFHVVEATTPGRHIDLRDVFSGRRCRVLERSASGMVKPEALLYAKVVTLDEGSIMVASAPLLIPPSWHTSLIDWRRQLTRKRRIDQPALLEFDAEIRSMYLLIAGDLRNPPLPKLTNTDGDPLELTTLEFELRCSPGRAYERLRHLEGPASADPLPPDATLDKDGELAAVEFSWIKPGNRMHKSWDNTVLGHLRIEGNRLTGEVNSTRRADRLRREVARRLGRDVTVAGSTTQSVEALLATRQAEAGSRASRVEERPPEPELDAEQQAALHEMMAGHWETWLDRRIPALGGKTSRQAAKTALGRERLDALLADYAWRAEEQPRHLRPDLDAIRRRLGLT